MYLARGVSQKDSGVFAIYEITALDPDRASECKGFGSSISGICNVFAHMSLIEPVAPALSLARMRADQVMRNTKFLRRNAQGTVFDITKGEFARLVALCRKQRANA